MRTAMILAGLTALALLVQACTEDPTPSPGGSGQVTTISESEFFARVARLGATQEPLTPQQSRIVSSGGDGETFYQDCDSSACWCVGGSDCLDMITSNDCAHLRCNGSPQGPVCWCDLEIVADAPGSLQGN